MKPQLCRFARSFFGLLFTAAAAGCGKVNGELHLDSPAGRYWDFVAQECHSTVGLHEHCSFVVKGVDEVDVAGKPVEGKRLCIGVYYDDFKQGWTVTLQDLSGADRLPRIIEARGCTRFNVYADSNWGTSGYLRLDCNVNSLVHLTGNLTFSFCGVSHRVD